MANNETLRDMSDVKGNYKAKRALEIAAAGGHNILMVGPPGSGKTMLAHRVQHITPRLSFEEALEATKIYSVAGLINRKNPLVLTRPFRSPHHSVSKAGLVGGGAIPKPGEISLAHNGILFMDEFPEFTRDTLESLRQPLEEGRVVVSRVNGSIEFPARMMLVAAMNPCPCGFLGDSSRECTCTPVEITRYKSRISGPLLDRIDIHIEVPRIKYQELKDNKSKKESSHLIRERVVRARKRQEQRFYGTAITTNAQMGSKELRSYCELTGKGTKLLKDAFERLQLSVRAYNRILKVARTIADLGDNDQIGPEHIAEAIQYRIFDRLYLH
jgi:magnesium chelatase family protein